MAPLRFDPAAMTITTCDHTEFKKSVSCRRPLLLSACLGLFVVGLVGHHCLRVVWDPFGNACQSAWEKAHAFFGGDQFAMYVWGSLLVLVTCYWTVGFVLALTGRCASFGHKSFSVRRVVNQVLFDQTFVGIPVFIGCFYIRKWRGFDDGMRIPPAHRVLADLLLCAAIQEIVCFCSHRLLRRHRTPSSPFSSSVASLYCHPLEHVLSSVLPVFLGPALLGSHVTFQWLWVMVATLFWGCHLPRFVSPDRSALCRHEASPVRKRHADKIRVKPDGA